MPQKPTTVLVMRGDSALSICRWLQTRVAKRRLAGNEALDFELAVVAEPLQAASGKSPNPYAVIAWQE